MDSGKLFRLSADLRQIALRASTAGVSQATTGSEVTVGADLAQHPDTTISEIVARTGLSQGAVSRAVAAMAAEGYAEMGRDEADRRRTRVRLTAGAAGFRDLGRRGIGPTLRETYDLDAAQARRAEDLLDQLHALLGAHRDRSG